MSERINNIIVSENTIYLKTIENNSLKKTECIDLRKIGAYGDNEKAIVIEILRYAIENNCEFNSSNSITKPYFLTMRNINKDLKNKQYITKNNDLLYVEYTNAVAELHYQFYNIKKYLYENTELKLNENGKVDQIGGIYVPILFNEIKDKFKEPIKISIDEYRKAIREIHEKICNCRYVISKEGKRYIALANENELEDNLKIKKMKKQNIKKYLELVAERNHSFRQYTGISSIFFINDNFCIEDTYSECLNYDIRSNLVKYLQQNEVIDKIDCLNEDKEEEIQIN